jgi:hypothetical protein
MTAAKLAENQIPKHVIDETAVIDYPHMRKIGFEIIEVITI